MKRDRQEKIIRLIESQNIGTQEDLARLLKEAGYHVTQATVSRDIRELGLTKVTGIDGKQKYVAVASHSAQLEDKFVRVLRAGFLSMDCAQNLVVLKTVTGMGEAVGAALDALAFDHVIGCIGGDDTIIIVVKTQENVPEVMRLLEEAIRK